MPSLRHHVVLLCLVAGYFITVESRHYVIKDSYNRNSDSTIRKKPHGVAGTTKLLNKLLTQGKLKQNDIEAIIMKIVKKRSHSKKRNAKRNLRNGMEVRGFLHKLNHFINQNTRHNYHSEKRNDCNFGFGNPSRVCKRQKFRRDAIGKSKKHEDNRKEKGVYNYAQHMLVERAKYDSSSSSSSESSDASRIKKSRFQIVSNKHKKKTRGSKETEEQSKDNSEESDSNIPVDTTQHDSDSDNADSAEDQPKQKKKYVSDENTNIGESSMEHNSNAAETKASTEQSESSMEASKESKYMYLQGTRLQKPSFKARLLKAIRRNDRLPYFMPKKYKWDDGMIHHLDTYWENIKAYDTYHKNFEQTWQ